MYIHPLFYCQILPPGSMRTMNHHHFFYCTYTKGMDQEEIINYPFGSSFCNFNRFASWPMQESPGYTVIIFTVSHHHPSSALPQSSPPGEFAHCVNGNHHVKTDLNTVFSHVYIITRYNSTKCLQNIS